MLTKHKKISVRFFLNKAVPYIPESNSITKDTTHPEEFYPVYLQVTYNRKNTQFKSCVEEYVTNLDLLSEESKSKLKFQESYLKKIILYEDKDESENYSLKSLKERYDYYTQFISMTLWEKANAELNQILRNFNENHEGVFNYGDPETKMNRQFEFQFDLPKVKVGWDSKIGAADSFLSDEFKKNIEYQRINRALFYVTAFFPINHSQNFPYSSPRLIDWLNGNIKDQLKEALKNEAGYKDEMDNIFETIDYYLIKK